MIDISLACRSNNSGQKYRLILSLGLVAFLGGACCAARASAAEARSPNARAKVAPLPAAINLIDWQAIPIDHGQFLVRIRSDGPLAFDRVKSSEPRQVLVRFHNARVVNLPALDPLPIGALSWSIGGRGEVTLVIDLTQPSAKVSIAQGGNSNIVEVRLRD
jgi:hypothetical protein